MDLLKQSTAATVLVGPVLDSTGAAYTGMAIGDFNITKNGSTAAMAAAATATHSHEGHYLIALTTGNTDTLGRLAISCNKSTYAMPPARFSVVTANVFDSLVAASDNLQVDSTQFNGDATAAAALAAFWSGQEYGAAQAGGASTITLRSGASSSDNLYRYSAIAILSGTGAKQVRKISSYVGSTKVATVSSAWDVQPDNTSVYMILGRIE